MKNILVILAIIIGICIVAMAIISITGCASQQDTLIDHLAAPDWIRTQNPNQKPK